MQKSQLATNRNKKASSAGTLKASYLKLVSERDTNMNNGNALATNNQLPDEIALIIYQAKLTHQTMWSSSKALHTLGTMIKEGINKENLKGIGYNIELLANNLMDWSLSLEKTLADGGFDNE